MLSVVNGYHQLSLLLEDWLSQLTLVCCQWTYQLNDDQNVSNPGYFQETCSLKH